LLKCNEIARILSSGEDVSWMKQAQLKMHLAMCKHCSRYAEQLHMIAGSARRLFASQSEQDLEKLEAQVIREHSSKKTD